MKKFEIEKIAVNFDEEVEGTFVVSVEIDGREFDVNCQTWLDYNYKETVSLTCMNESGGDIYASGLFKYLNEEYEIDDCGEPFNSICKIIENCAEEHTKENTIERILYDNEGKEFTHTKSLFGAFGPTDVHHHKYVASCDGEIIVTSEDTSQNRVENQLLGYKHFESEEEYQEWKDGIYGPDGHYGDCSVSYRAFQDIVGNDE